MISNAPVKFHRHRFISSICLVNLNILEYFTQRRILVMRLWFGRFETSHFRQNSFYLSFVFYQGILTLVRIFQQVFTFRFVFIGVTLGRSVLRSLIFVCDLNFSSPWSHKIWTSVNYCCIISFSKYIPSF